MEVLEHVDHPAAFLDTCSRLLKPNGHLFLSTMARTPLAYFLTIFMALGLEYFYRLLRDLPIRPEDSTVYAADGTVKSDTSLSSNEKGRARFVGLTKMFVIGAFISCFCLFIR